MSLLAREDNGLDQAGHLSSSGLEAVVVSVRLPRMCSTELLAVR